MEGLVLSEGAVRTAQPPSHVQLACSLHGFLAAPHARSPHWLSVSRLVHPLFGTDTDLDTDTGLGTADGGAGWACRAHRSAVVALAFVPTASPPVVLSASQDGVLRWDVCSGEETWLSRDIGLGEHLAVSSDGRLVAVCAGREVLVLDAEEPAQTGPRIVLAGHSGLVNAAAFCPHSACVVTVSEDRSFFVWDLDAQQLVYQSPILGPAPLLAVAMDPVHERCAVGSGDGRVRVYDLRPGCGYRCLGETDVAAAAATAAATAASKAEGVSAGHAAAATVVIRPGGSRAAPAAAAGADTQAPGLDAESAAVAGRGILAMAFVAERFAGPAGPQARLAREFLQPDTDGSGVLDRRLSLVVGTGSCLMAVDVLAQTVVSTLRFGDPRGWVGGAALDGCFSSVSFAPSSGRASLGACLVVVGSAFEPSVVPVFVTLPEAPQASGGAAGGGERKGVSMLSSEPLAANSPLRSSLVPKSKGRGRGKGGPAARGRKSGLGAAARRGSRAVDSPVTFGRKITSSGYGSEQPKRKLFQPQTKFGSPTRRRTKAAEPKPPALGQAYPLDCSAPTRKGPEVRLGGDGQACSITCLRYSPDGSQVACALSDGSVQVVRSSLRDKGSKSLVHGAQMASVHWASSGSHVVSSGENQCINIWAPGCKDAKLEFTQQQHNFKAKAGDPPNPALRHLGGAQFFYLDKFVLAAQSADLLLFKYFLEDKGSDLKTYENRSRYRLAARTPHPTAKGIAAFEAVNGFHSPLCIVAGTDRSLAALDLNVGKAALVVADAHTRPITGVRVNEATPFVNRSPELYDLVLSSSSGDGVALWDLRSAQRVRRFSDHQHRGHRSGMDFSPCGRFVAVSSDDRSALLYDIRSGSCVERLSKHADAVTDVRFHPAKAQLMTGCSDGTLRIYRDAT